MKLKFLPQKGVMTLTLLIILSSILLLLLLFDDDNLRLHSALASQRQKYVKDSIELQITSHNQQQQACQQLSLQEAGNVQIITINQENDENGLQQFFYCKRNALFKLSPTKNTYENQLDTYIYQEKLLEFAPHFTLPQNGKQSTTVQLYWFNEPNAEWIIESDVSGVILAKGNLRISGKGKISGTIILGGDLTLDNVTLSYKKAAVTQIVQQFSEWQLAKQSWYDFKVF